MKAVYDGNGGIFFINSPSVTGKTFFFISLILDTIRAQSQIAASSGIAATLLEGGGTAPTAIEFANYVI